MLGDIAFLSLGAGPCSTWRAWQLSALLGLCCRAVLAEAREAFRADGAPLCPQSRRLDEIIVFRQLSKGEVKEIADIMLREVFRRAETKGITIDVTERFKVRLHCGWVV